jgi:dihydrofolate reductase
VTRDPAATIGELKERSGKDIWLWGSLKLMHSLLHAGVVDEVRMLVCPVSRGNDYARISRRMPRATRCLSFQTGQRLFRP